MKDIRMKIRISCMTAALALIAATAACSQQTLPPSTTTATTVTTQEAARQHFFDAIARRCGKAFAGKLVSTDAADADMANKTMVMHISACSEDEIRIPFHV
ncbi:MAG: hypothetical protein WAV67_03970, partial [Dokdonella sp.]